MKESLPEPVFLSAPKAATLCGVSRNTICCWIRDGRMPSYRTAGGKYLIRPADLLGFMRDNAMFVPPMLESIAEEDLAVQGSAAALPRRETNQEPAILVVDDDSVVRQLTVRSLSPLGQPILQAENGFEAMHLLTKNPHIALVVLDLVMPGQGGGRTFEQIREMSPKLPVIICTGQSLEEAESIFGDNKPDLILTKPYQTSHLVTAASAFLADIGI